MTATTTATAHLTTTNGLVTAASTITINGQTYPVPARVNLPSGQPTIAAPARIGVTLRAAGYQWVGAAVQQSPTLHTLTVVPIS